MNKPLHPGKAAANGLVAATVAAHGLTASPSALDCARGYFAAMAPELDVAKLLDGWGPLVAAYFRRSAGPERV